MHENGSLARDLDSRIVLARFKVAFGAAPLRSAVLVASLLGTLSRTARDAARLRFRVGEGERNNMLKIYPVIVQLLSDLRPAIARIEKCDRDLGRQMRRASASMVLNCAEGAWIQTAKSSSASLFAVES